MKSTKKGKAVALGVAAIGLVLLLAAAVFFQEPLVSVWKETVSRDSGSLGQRLRTRIYRVRVRKAGSLAQELQGFFQTAIAQGNPPMIEAHEETNSVIIQALPDDYEAIVAQLEKLDRRRP